MIDPLTITTTLRWATDGNGFELFANRLSLGGIFPQHGSAVEWGAYAAFEEIDSVLNSRSFVDEASARAALVEAAVKALTATENSK